LSQYSLPIAIALFASSIYGCATFRGEVPEVFYRAALVEPAVAQICDELSRDIAVQEGLIDTTRADPVLAAQRPIAQVV
jgi:hypothetical protein